MALFEGKQNVHLYVRFLAKLGAPLSSELLNTLSRKNINSFLRQDFDFEVWTRRKWTNQTIWNASKNLKIMSMVTWKHLTRFKLILSKCWMNPWNWMKFCKKPFLNELNNIWNRTTNEFLAKKSMENWKPECKMSI